MAISADVTVLDAVDVIEDVSEEVAVELSVWLTVLDPVCDADDVTELEAVVLADKD